MNIERSRSFHEAAIRHSNETARTLPQDFLLPEVLPPDEEEYESTDVVDFPVVIQEKELRVTVTIKRYKDDAPQRARVELESYDDSITDGDKRVSSFKAMLAVKNPTYGHQVRDGKTHPHWHIHTRRIEKPMRKKGFGEWNMKALEETVKELEKQDPRLRADWIQLATQLSSLSNLIVDPNWLEQQMNTADSFQSQILHDRAANKEKNLGYVPHPKDVHDALAILCRSEEEVEELSDSVPEVLYIKPLRDDIEFERVFGDQS